MSFDVDINVWFEIRKNKLTIYSYVYQIISGSNIMGKFTQSVKRLVQEVKEVGVPGKNIYYIFLDNVIYINYWKYHNN